jgi:hypothetical protein
MRRKFSFENFQAFIQGAVKLFCFTKFNRPEDKPKQNVSLISEFILWKHRR